MRGRARHDASLGSRDGEVPHRYLIPYLLNRVTSRFHQLWRAELGREGPTLHRWQVLSILNGADGLRLGQIARLAGVDQPVMSRVIDQMERDALVERRPASDDQRGVEVWLTALGSATFADLLPRASALVDRAMTDLTAADVETLHDLLARVLTTIDHDEDATGGEDDG